MFRVRCPAATAIQARQATNDWPIISMVLVREGAGISLRAVGVEVAQVAIILNLRQEHLPNFINSIFNRPLLASRRIRFLHHKSIPFEYTSVAHTAPSDRSSSEPLRYFRHIFRLHHGLRR